MNLNIRIIETKANTKKCLIAFSSNNFYEKEKFEFENICKQMRIRKRFKKIIFLRDPERHFYIDGIGGG